MYWSIGSASNVYTRNGDLVNKHTETYTSYALSRSSSVSLLSKAYKHHRNI